MDLLDGFLFFDCFFCDLVFGFLAELYRCYGKLCIVRKVCRIGKSNLDIDLVTLVIISGDLRLNFFFLHILRLFCLITAVNNLCHITSYVSFGSFPGNLVPGCSVLCCYGIQKCELCSCVYSCQNLCLGRWADTKIRIVSQNLDQACLTILICCRNILFLWRFGKRMFQMPQHCICIHESVLTLPLPNCALLSDLSGSGRTNI